MSARKPKPVPQRSTGCTAAGRAAASQPQARLPATDTGPEPGQAGQPAPARPGRAQRRREGERERDRLRRLRRGGDRLRLYREELSLERARDSTRSASAPGHVPPRHGRLSYQAEL